MGAVGATGLREVNATTARNLSLIFDEAVRKERPVILARGGHERGVLIARDQLLRLLAPTCFRVDFIPEDSGFTLWLDELEIGGYGKSLADARADLLAAVRAYVADYLWQLDEYLRLPALARLEPYVIRLALASDDAGLVATLLDEGEVPSA